MAYRSRRLLCRAGRVPWSVTVRLRPKEECWPTISSSKDSRGEPSIRALAASAGHLQSRRRSSRARPVSSAAHVVRALLDSGRKVVGLDVRGFQPEGRFILGDDLDRRAARDRVRRRHRATQRRDPTPSSERDRPHGDDHRPRVPRDEPHDRDSGEHPRDGERPRSDVGLRRRPRRELLLDRGASERRVPADRRQSPHRAGRRRGRARTSTARPRPPPSFCASRTTRPSASTSAPSAHPRSTGSE